MYICENCGKEHDGTYGSGRFCSKECSSVRHFSKDAIEKIRKSLLGKHCKRNKKLCDKCGKEISLSNFKRHYDSCNNKQPHKKINESWKQENGLYKCPHCEKEYKKTGIATHIWRIHTEEGKKFSTNNGFKNGRVIWNKGLTKETDERIKKQSITYTKRIKSGEIIPHQKGKSLSPECKKHLSKKLIIYLQEYPDRVPYIINHSSKMSYPEKIMYDALEMSSIKGWVYKYRNSIYEYDFALPELKIDIEVDGSTHNSEKVKKIDERRDKFSEKNGWKVLRFPADEVKHNVQECIKKIKFFINNASNA